MLIEGIKKKCEEIAQGNNGRIRPGEVSIRGGLQSQVIGEIQNGYHDSYSVDLVSNETRMDFINIEWKAFHWGYHVDGVEESKSYILKKSLHSGSEGDGESFHLNDIQCNECGNEPFQDSEGCYYCPVCVQ